jgi:dienelactone hydrolase
MDLSPEIYARALALKRRLTRLLGGEFDPYPPPPEELSLNPSDGHYAAYDDAPLALSWLRAGLSDVSAWQSIARAKLEEITGYNNPGTVPTIRHDRQFELPGGLVRRQVYIAAAPGEDIPVNLISTRESPTPRPVMICLHGTNSGAHLSWGQSLMPADPLKIRDGADYALQAVARGYLAVCIEQRCFGERREQRIKEPGQCATAANHALLLGRSLVGERVSDVSVVINWLASGAADTSLDLTRLHVLGNSSGGTTAVYAAALDLRIQAVLASGCIGFIRDTIGRRRNDQGQAVVPGILKWFEFDDVVALAAPRAFVGIAGKQDHIFPFGQCEAVIERAARVYAALGARNAIRAVAGESSHRFYPESAWPAFESVLNNRSGTSNSSQISTRAEPV